MSVVLLFPTTPQTTSSEMNYTVVVMGGVIVIALVYYYFPRYGGVHCFEGPVRNLPRNDEKEDVEIFWSVARQVQTASDICMITLSLGSLACHFVSYSVQSFQNTLKCMGRQLTLFIY